MNHIVTLSALWVGGSASRYDSSLTGSRGTVDELYTYGGPSLAKSPLTSFGGCFKGLRVVATSVKKGWFEMDRISKTGRRFGFHSPLLELIEVDVDTYKGTKRGCSPDVVDLPDGDQEWDLHNWLQYNRTMWASPQVSDYEAAISEIGCITSFENNTQVAIKQVERVGYKLIGTARHKGGFIIGGEQVAHLAQHPDTLDCILTWQGSASKGDWWNNARVAKRSFCGLPQKVHKGLRSAMEMMAKCPEWQANIRSKLPFCNKLISTGQSQGSGQAELFAACLNQHAPDDNDRWYSQISFTKQAPKRMF